MRSAHTRGPWTAKEVIGLPDEDWWSIVALHGTEEVAIIPRRNETDAQNARLIAAAPELLAIAQRWGALDGGAWHVERHAAEKAELLADTRGAIAKATGL
jgi:hypothetical protein